MFEFRRMNNVGVCAPAIKQMPATAATEYKIGEALVISGGKVAKATGTSKPEYICAEEGTGKDTISCYPVDEHSEYKTTVNGDGAVTVGAKYTIHTDSAQITTTTTGGVAEVVEVLTDGVVVRF